jgi:hypothetical protein
MKKPATERPGRASAAGLSGASSIWFQISGRGGKKRFLGGRVEAFFSAINGCVWYELKMFVKLR